MIKSLLDYGWEIRDADTQRIDIPAMKIALNGLHASGYCYGLVGNPTLGFSSEYNFLDLPPFLDTVLPLDVWVILSSDSMPASNMEPYGHDYVAWIQAIATLSLAHRNLKGIIMDDFVYSIVPPIGSSGKSTGLFTTSYIRQVYDAKNAINPNLKLIAGFYTRPEGRAGEPTPEIWSAYGDSFDGIQMAHWDINQPNSFLAERLTHAREIISPKHLKGLFYAVAPYEGPWQDPDVNEGGTILPTSELLDGWIQTIYDNCDSVTAYCTPKPTDWPQYFANVWTEYSWIYDVVSAKYGELTPIFPLAIVAVAVIPVAVVLWWLLKK